MASEPLSDWVFDFNLSKNIAYLGNLKGSGRIEFKKQDKYITGVSITVTNSSRDDAERIANNEAKNLKNILTIKSGMPTELVLRGYHSVPKPGVPGKVVANFVIGLGGIEGGITNLDLSDSHLQTIIASIEPSSLIYDYVSKGIFHYYSGNPVDCIKELFRAIERESSFSDYGKYELLRNLFSHKPPYIQKTVNTFLIYFGAASFEYKKYDPSKGWIVIDMESNKNIRSLNGIAAKFMDEIRGYLNLPRH